MIAAETWSLLNYFWSRGILVAMDNKAPQTWGSFTWSVNFLSDVLLVLLHFKWNDFYMVFGKAKSGFNFVHQDQIW